MLTISFHVLSNAAFTRAIRFTDRATGSPVSWAGDTYTMAIQRDDFRGPVLSVPVVVDPETVAGNRIILSLTKSQCAGLEVDAEYVGQIKRDSDQMLMARVRVGVDQGVGT